MSPRPPLGVREDATASPAVAPEAAFPRRLWRAALAAFVLAGATGAGYRLAVFVGFHGLDPTNVRHAHSHLMFFSWVTPALMLLLLAHLPPSRTGLQTGRRTMRRAALASLVLGFASYPPFLLYGYGVAHIGALRMPLSVIASTANMLAWYVFAASYVRATRGHARTRPLRLWDAAVGLLVVSTFGAWLLGLLQMRGGATEFALAAALHLFVHLFAEGWFVLALLGVLHAQYPVKDAASGRMADLGTALAAWALPLTFLLGVRVALVPADLRAIAGAAGVVVAAGLALHGLALWRAGAPRLPLAFLLVRSAMLAAASFPAVARWGEGMGLRILFLHVMLLGFVSVGIVEAARRAWGDAATPARRAFALGVALLVASLVPLSGVWPLALSGAWTWRFAAGAALVPVAAAAWMALHAKAAR